MKRQTVTTFALTLTTTTEDCIVGIEERIETVRGQGYRLKEQVRL